MRIDSHQHFWRYCPDQYGWIGPDMAALQRDFLPDDLLPLLQSIDFDGTVAVQARQSLEETEWLLHLSDEHGFIEAVVGWVDLCAKDVRRQLERFADHPCFRGVRHVLQDERDDRYMLRPDFTAGIAALADFGLAYDLLVYPPQLPAARELAGMFPDQTFVLDHLGKPRIRERLLDPWSDDLKRLAEHPNVFCKVSGLVTEAEWSAWRPADLDPYLEALFTAFDPERLMIGSDWPVCTLAGEYRDVMGVVLAYVDGLPEAQQQGILGDNAVRAYRIEP